MHSLWTFSASFFGDFTIESLLLHNLRKTKDLGSSKFSLLQRWKVLQRNCFRNQVLESLVFFKKVRYFATGIGSFKSLCYSDFRREKSPQKCTHGITLNNRLHTKIHCIKKMPYGISVVCFTQKRLAKQLQVGCKNNEKLRYILLLLGGSWMLGLRLIVRPRFQQLQQVDQVLWSVDEDLVKWLRQVNDAL